MPERTFAQRMARRASCGSSESSRLILRAQRDLLRIGLRSTAIPTQHGSLDERGFRGGASFAGDHETAGSDADRDIVTGEETGVDEPDAAQADAGDFAREVCGVDGGVVRRTDADLLCGRVT